MLYESEILMQILSNIFFICYMQYVLQVSLSQSGLGVLTMKTLHKQESACHDNFGYAKNSSFF